MKKKGRGDEQILLRWKQGTMYRERTETRKERKYKKDIK